LEPLLEEKIEINITDLLPGVLSEEDDCIQRLERSLQDQEGILEVHRVDQTDAPHLCLHFDPTRLSQVEVEKLIQKNSSKIARRYHHATIPIEGMDCSDCAIMLEHGLSRVEGILQVSASYAEQNLWIEYDTHHVRRSSIAHHVRRMGYSVQKTGLQRFLFENQSLILSLLAGAFLLLGWTGDLYLNFPKPVVITAYGLSYALGGLPLLRHAWAHLFRERSFDTDQLMLAAAIGAAILGHYSEGALLLFLFSLGHALEGRALARARKAILALANLTPRTARVIRDGREQVLPVEDILIKDHVLIPPGAKIPVDGIVMEGSSAVDLSSITGEPLPVQSSSGDQVFAGSVNGEGALKVEATRLAKDSTLSKVVRLVQQAQTQKSTTEQTSQRIIRILVPTILITDLLIIILPPLFGVPFQQSFLMAMTLLVAASPCALALGTPSAILAALARAGQKGVLIKGGAHLENMGKLQAIAFDKTGTITLGKPHVTDVLPLPTYTRHDVLRWAATAESLSAHPIAQAIVNATEEEGIAFQSPHSIQSHIGLGIQAKLKQDLISVGRAKPEDLTQFSSVQKIRSMVDGLEKQAKTIVLVQVNEEPIGIIAVADQIRPEVKETISHLKGIGLEQMLMLTGDNARSAASIASAAGLDHFHAGLMPEDKLTILTDWSAKYGSTAMVGDGVNDAPALANATVGIAMGGARTQVALETADVVLMSDDLSKLPFAIGLGQATSKVIRQNFVIALGVIATLIILTLLNLTGIGPAILLHEGSTVLVVFNSLRLLNYRYKNGPL
jgi:Cd2+/Zn2+-exporting ATPase